MRHMDWSMQFALLVCFCVQLMKSTGAGNIAVICNTLVVPCQKYAITSCSHLKFVHLIFTDMNLDHFPFTTIPN